MGSRVREVQNLGYKPVEGNFAKCQLLAVLLVNVPFLVLIQLSVEKQ